MNKYVNEVGAATLCSKIKNAEQIATSKADPSTTISVVLKSSGWTNGTQTITNGAILADSNGTIGLAQTASKAQREAAKMAQITIISQAAGSITLVADGDIPTVDIPVALVLVG